MSNIYMVRFITTIFFSFISLSVYSMQQQIPYQGGYPPQPVFPQAQNYQMFPSPNQQMNSTMTDRQAKSFFGKHTRSKNPFFALHSLVKDIKKSARAIGNNAALTGISQFEAVLYNQRTAEGTFKLQFGQSGVSIIQTPVKRFGQRPIFDQNTAYDLLKTLGPLPVDQVSFQAVSQKLQAKYRYAIRQKIKRGAEILRGAFVQAKYANTIQPFINKLMPAATFGQFIGNIDPSFVSPGVLLGPQGSMVMPTMMTAQGYPSSFMSVPNGSSMIGPGGFSYFPPSQSGTLNFGSPVQGQPFYGQQQPLPFGAPNSGFQSTIPQQNWNAQSQLPFGSSNFPNMGVPSFTQGQIPPYLQTQNPDQNNIILGLLNGIPPANLDNAYQTAMRFNLLTPNDGPGTAKIVQVLSQGNPQNLTNAASRAFAAGLLSNLSNYEKALLISKMSLMN